MKKLATLSAMALVLAACQPKQPAEPYQQVVLPSGTDSVSYDPETSGTALTPSEAAANPDANEEPVAEEEVVVAENTATGSTCLAAKVLTNDFEVLDAGTAGELSGDTFTTGGKSYDLSGIGYSTKPC